MTRNLDTRSRGRTFNLRALHKKVDIEDYELSNFYFIQKKLLAQVASEKSKKGFTNLLERKWPSRSVKSTKMTWKTDSL